MTKKQPKRRKAKPNHLYFVMAVNFSSEPFISGMVGVIPAFRTKKEADAFSGGRFDVKHVKLGKAK